MIAWNLLTSEEQLITIAEKSFLTPQIIFKHSTRCSISQATGEAHVTGEPQWDLENKSLNPFLLDLLSFRAISNEIAAKFKIEHASPQILLIQNGICTYATSHNDINVADLKEQLIKV